MAEVKDIRGRAGCREATEENVNAAGKEVFCCPGLWIQLLLFVLFGTEVRVGPAVPQRCTVTDGGL